MGFYTADFKGVSPAARIKFRRIQVWLSDVVEKKSGLGRGMTKILFESIEVCGKQTHHGQTN